MVQSCQITSGMWTSFELSWVVLKLFLSCLVDCNYLQKVPNQEKWIDFGCQWLRVAWKPSRQLVWVSGDSFLMSAKILVLDRIEEILSYAFVPDRNVNKKKKHIVINQFTGIVAHKLTQTGFVPFFRNKFPGLSRTSPGLRLSFPGF